MDTHKANSSFNNNNEPLRRFLEIYEKINCVIIVSDKFMNKIFKESDFPSTDDTVVEAYNQAVMANRKKFDYLNKLKILEKVEIFQRRI